MQTMNARAFNNRLMSWPDGEYCLTVNGNPARVLTMRRLCMAAPEPQSAPGGRPEASPRTGGSDDGGAAGTSPDGR